MRVAREVATGADFETRPTAGVATTGAIGMSTAKVLDAG